jgi:flagellar hook protein FlgE
MFGTTPVGKIPNSTPVLNGTNYEGMITVNQQQVVKATANGMVLGETVYDGSNQLSITDPDGNKVVIDVADVNAFRAAITAGGATGADITVGSLASKLVSDLNFSGNVASAQAGDGEKVWVGNIAIAKVANMAAMEQDGTSYFVTSANSGAATFWKPGISGTGTLRAGNLEMSNVDVSKEFTDMITTQRGFQANTRIITVSDEMLNELVNLKR